MAKNVLHTITIPSTGPRSTQLTDNLSGVHHGHGLHLLLFLAPGVHVVSRFIRYDGHRFNVE